MTLTPPRSTRTVTLFPSTTLFRSVAGAHGGLLAPRQRHVVLLAVDVEAQLAVLALGDLDLVVAVAGLEHELVGKHRVLAGARVGFGGALAGDLDLRGAAELVDEQRLPGAAPGQLTGAGVVGVAVDFRGLPAPAIGVVDRQS